MSTGADPRVTVHTSWRGLASAVASPVLVLTFGLLLAASSGPGPVAIGALLLGAGLALVSAFDYPRRVEFATDGIRRVCLLRRQLLPWSTLVAIERTAGTARDALRRGEGGAKVASGGLVARGLGKRRWLLTDRIESQAEFDAVRSLLDELDVATVVRAARPSDTVPPTDLYRRSRREEAP